MSDSIPIEIQTEILKRVPVKSLFQFRSVSKSWKSLIDSSQFIADYNEYQSRPQRLFIGYEDHLYPDVRSEIDLKYVTVVDDDIFPQNKFPTTFPITMVKSFVLNIDTLRLVCSSQGLLCFMGEYKDDDDTCWDMAYIWNPAIRKSIAIDLPLFHYKALTDLGFGVCPNTNEPVLVVITECDVTIDIFRLSSRVWRKPRGNLPSNCINFKERRLAIDGFIYWETDNRLILSFDMTSEDFTEIKLPKSFASTTHWSISNLRGSLAVLEYGELDEKPVYDVWIMEHGVPKSFTKLYTITKPNGFLLGFRMNGDLILKVVKTYKEPQVLEVYEPHTEHIKDLGIYANWDSIFLMSYMETLVLLDQVDFQHIEHPNFVSD